MAQQLVTSLRRVENRVEKALRFEPGERHELCRLEGAGRILRFWCTVPVLGQRNALKQLVLRMYWDQEPTPSVEASLGDFFGATFGKPRALVSQYLVIAGGGYLCRFEMPFNDGARIELVNDSTSPVSDFFFQLGWHDSQGTSREATFHAQHRVHHVASGDAAVPVLEASGRGTFVGLRLDLQGDSWWLRPPVKDIVLPRGFGLGLLEGWERVVIDGDEARALVGTGAEDYFSSGFYFRGAPFCTPTHGCTLRSFLFGRASAYRFHVDDPIHFERTLSFTLDHGLENSMAGDYSTVAYWYQTEPHSPFAAYASASARQPHVPLRQLAQWSVLAGLGALVVAVGWLVLRLL